MNVLLVPGGVRWGGEGLGSLVALGNDKWKATWTQLTCLYQIEPFWGRGEEAGSEVVPFLCCPLPRLDDFGALCSRLRDAVS